MIEFRDRNYLTLDALFCASGERVNRFQFQPRRGEVSVPALFNQKLRESRPVPRIFLWTLLGVFNAFLWLMLLAFHWEISMRSREVKYFGTQLFPVPAQ